VLLKEKPVKPSVRHHSAADQAKALAIILREEFGVPFAFYDSATGAAVWGRDRQERPGSSVELPPDVVAALAADGRVQATRLGDGRYRLTLLLYETGKPILVAAGVIPAMVAAGSEAAREQERLQKWVQAVADRLRLSDQLVSRRRLEEEQNAQVTVAWEAVLSLDHLVRHLRIHKNPEKNLKRILEAAAGALHAQSLIWVPQQLDAPVQIQGEACLALPDCRQLASTLTRDPEFRPAEPFLCNKVQETSWGARFPQVGSLIAFTLTDPATPGWLIGVNKQPAGRAAEAGAASGDNLVKSGPFRRADAALLTPFVGLLQLCARGTSRYQELKELLVGLTRSLTSALDAKDSYTFGHSERVARIALELAREMGLQGDELSDIYLTGLLHDVGKIGIRDAVLGKPGPLTPEEFEHIKQHVTIGYKILADLRPIRSLLPGVLYHHERYDGKGYPDGLAGESIPLLARILAVADSYDAMSTARPYREAMPCRRVEEVLLQGGGTQWDQRVIDAFARCRQRIHAIRQRGVGESLCQAIDGALRTGESSHLWKAKPAEDDSVKENQPKENNP